MTTPEISSLLKSVQKPGQYLGNEVNAVHKDFNAQKVRVALIFPDAYEMGMSHMGLKILYEILNSIDGVVAERCFAPLPDMEKILREQNVPLFALESKTPLKEFDIVGISLPYELTYTNALNILDLAQIPVWQKDRGSHHPLILGGGTQSYNPEVMADFFDAIAVGDAEELIVDVVNCVLNWKEKFGVDKISENKNLKSRADLLDDARRIEGIYVPSFFTPDYFDDGRIKTITPLKADYTGVKKRVVKDLNAQPYPTKLVVPNIKLIHDRIGIEIQRGCTRMCRFCQAGYIERPTRQRSPEKVLEIAEESLKATGIDEISLLSLSAGDYATIVPTLKELNRRYEGQKISISVPATRTETLTPEMIAEVKKVRKTGFTIAPEAGSERMRRVINKGNKVEDLMGACRNAFSAGYKLIKFYYMCGLPFETDEDVIGIAKESDLALRVGREYARDVTINVSVSSFVPKPFTPFQWAPQMTIEETRRKHSLVRQNLHERALHFKHHTPEMSFLEGLFSRGDRKLSALIFQAFKNGCRFDEWREHFDFRIWQKSIDELKIDTDFYITRERAKDEVFPWEHLFTQMLKDWLWKEFEAARDEAYIADCSVDKCAQFCGVCDFKEVKNKIYVIDEKPIAVKKGNREAYGRFGDLRRGGVSPPAPLPAPLPADHVNLHMPSPATIPESNATTDEPETHGCKENENLPSHDHGRGDPAPTQTPNSKLRVPSIPKSKLRVRFTKTGLAALIGHLELMGMLKRAILRSGFSVAYSEGFHPQMRLSMGLALSVGIESEWEYFDLVLLKYVYPDDFISKINEALPLGLSVVSAEYVDLHAPSIYSVTTSVDYEVRFDAPLTDQKVKCFAANLSDLLNGKSFSFTKTHDRKKDKTIDLAEKVRFAREAKNNEFYFKVLCNAQGSLRPTDVVATLSGFAPNELVNAKVKKVGIEFKTSF